MEKDNKATPESETFTKADEVKAPETTTTTSNEQDANAQEAQASDVDEDAYDHATAREPEPEVEDALFTETSKADAESKTEEPSTQNPMAEFMLGDPVANPAGGDITRMGGPVAGVEYRSSTHPYKVFIGGVSPVASEHDLFSFFERKIGTVAHLTLALDTMRPERYHKGYGFVVFASQALRDKCLEHTKYSFMDREIEVKAVESGRSKVPGVGGTSTGTGEVPDGCKLFVAIKSGSSNQGGLDPDELTNHFNHYGNVKRVVIVKDRVTGASKGFGFVYFASPESPMIAIGAGREHLIGTLKVEIKQFTPVGAPGMMPSYGMPSASAPPSVYSPYGMPYGMYGMGQAASPYGMASYGGASPYGAPGSSPYGASPYAAAAAPGTGATPPAGAHPGIPPGTAGVQSMARGVMPNPAMYGRAPTPQGNPAVQQQQQQQQQQQPRPGMGGGYGMY